MTNNLKRVTDKIFGSAAPSDKIGQFGSALTGTKLNTAEIDQIQALPAYETGWSSAVLTTRNYPTLEEMNGVMKVMSYQTAYTHQKGVAEWDSNTTYYTGDMCKGVGVGILYVSRSNNNLGHELSDTEYWAEYQGSALNLPATNYISEMSGSATYTGNTITLPAITFYAADGRYSDKSLQNKLVNIPAGSFEVGGTGTYNLFYNNDTENLLLAMNYTKYTDSAPDIALQNDVWLSNENEMYYVNNDYPNYTAGSGVEVTSEGIVSGLGTLSLNTTWQVSDTPAFNIGFTTGEDITTAQTLFTVPFATATIQNSEINVDIFSYAYNVNYYSTLYSGTYSLTESDITYNYSLTNNITIYAKQVLTNGLTVYTDKNVTSAYGTVTELSGGSVTISNVTTAYDGGYTLDTTTTSPYTYTLDDESIVYCSTELAADVEVYNDESLTSLFGTVASLTSSNVLIQASETVYSGTYTTNDAIELYTYNLGGTEYYTNTALTAGAAVYTDEGLTTQYGTVQSTSGTTVIIQSLSETKGYVSVAGTNTVASGILIYSDSDLTEQTSTSNGANAVYSGGFIKSKAGTITENLTASTAYTGSLTYNGTTYQLTLNTVGATLLSDRAPYTFTTTVTFGSTSTTAAYTLNLNDISIPNVWSWNGLVDTTPNWEKATLCELGTVTILGGVITELNFYNPVELAKITDIKEFANKSLINTNKMKSCVLGYISALSYEESDTKAVFTLPLGYHVIFSAGVNSDNSLNSTEETTTEDLTLTINSYNSEKRLIYLANINSVFSLRWGSAKYVLEQDEEPTNATEESINYVWISKKYNTWKLGNNVNGWTQFLGCKVAELTSSTTQIVESIKILSPVIINEQTDLTDIENSITSLQDDKVDRAGDTMTGTLNIKVPPSSLVSSNIKLLQTQESHLPTITTVDPDGNNISRLQFGYNESNYLREIMLYLYGKSDSTWHGMGLFENTSTNTIFSTCISPTSAADSSQKIATTEWVKRALTNSGAALGSWKNASNGYMKFSNNFTVQWGVFAVTSSATVTLPVAFSNTNYRVVATQQSPNPANDYTNSFRLHDIATTCFYVNTFFSETNVHFYWIAAGF